jgi:hypothetical protein
VAEEYGESHWSVRTLARQLGISRTMVHRVWQRFDIQPHRVEKFKISNDPKFEESNDPKFEEKVPTL